ncbi:sigma-70 family RNA polymerase sigma factor, partial [Candidatus Pacearchaeota archaeon]|nr:sigma-70 family RNA polymerase sigma factor [Candidatus Pacearchaeota archaeon]
VMFGFRNLIRDLKRRNISYSLESYLVDEEENLDKLGFMEDKSVPLPSRGAELADERKNLEFLIRENLTEKQQQHIYFSYFGELDRKEVANLVGCTSANVGISINRSLETLRDVIGQEELAGVN